jgi:S-formylglutathione hydrolase FrmB
MLRKFFILSILCLTSTLLGGCQNSAQPASNILSTPAQTATLEPSLTPLPSATPLPTATTAPTATPSPLGCPDLKGKIEQRQMEAKILGKSLEINIYTPPCYDKKKSGGYPVLILLHGQSSTDSQWIDLGAGEIADRLMVSGQLPPFLIVMPQEDYYLEDFPKSKFGEVVLQLPSWIKQEYNACGLRECTALGGLSRGAIWAVKLGLQNGQTFGSIGAHSLADNPFEVFILRDLLKSYPDKPRLYIDSGYFDLYLKSAIEFEGVLNQLHLQHTWILQDGAHNSMYWASHVEEYLRWYAAPWKK